MTEEVNFNLDVAKESMDDVITRLEVTLSKIRAGKANPQMLSSVKARLLWGSNSLISSSKYSFN